MFYFWRFDFYQRPSSEEAGTRSSGFWHDEKMLCQESCCSLVTELISALIPIHGLSSFLVDVHSFFNDNPSRKLIWLSVDHRHLRSVVHMIFLSCMVGECGFSKCQIVNIIWLWFTKLNLKVFASAFSVHTSQVDVQLNSTMRLISGTLHSTFLPWLPVLTNIEPPALWRKAATDKLVEKIVKHNSWPIQPNILNPPLLTTDNIQEAVVAGLANSWHQKSMEAWLEVDSGGQLSPNVRPHNQTIGFRPPSAELLSRDTAVPAE